VALNPSTVGTGDLDSNGYNDGDLRLAHSISCADDFGGGDGYRVLLLHLRQWGRLCEQMRVSEGSYLFYLNEGFYLARMRLDGLRERGNIFI
jgi:hypothetical protein